MRCGAVMSLEGQMGQSDEIHSPEECANTVVRRICSVFSSTIVVWIVAISCSPRLFRTISNPLASEAYRNVRSPSQGKGERMVATSDFSGLVSSRCALASARASAPIESLERCIGDLRIQEVKANGPAF